MNDVEEKYSMEKLVFPGEDFKLLAKDNEAKKTMNAFHEEIEIKYYYEGQSAMMIDSKAVFVSAGDVVVVNPYEIHTNIRLDEFHGRYYSLVISFDFLSSLPRDFPDLRKILITDGKKFDNLIRGDERIATVVRRIFEEMNAEAEYYRVVVRSLTCELFSLLMRGYLSGGVSWRTDRPPFGKAKAIAPAISEICRNYSEKISLDRLASVCGFSKYYFCRVFRSVMGKTVTEYVTDYRLAVADVMMKDGSLDMGEIAFNCGFCDESYFYRCYKKKRGTLPKRQY